MFTGSIRIDFDVFKAITARRSREEVTENDVLRDLFGLGAADNADPAPTAPLASWQSEGVTLRAGTKLRHRFRGGKTVEASITPEGVLFEGVVYGGLSPAAVAAAGHQANGWQFWEVLLPTGKWVKADVLRHDRT